MHHKSAKRNQQLLRQTLQTKLPMSLKVALILVVFISLVSVDKPAVAPLITTTTINVVKLMGQYINMMKTLSSVAPEIFQGFQQMVAYYSLAVLHLFGPNLSLPTLRLSTLQREQILHFQSYLKRGADDKVRILFHIDSSIS